MLVETGFIFGKGVSLFPAVLYVHIGQDAL